MLVKASTLLYLAGSAAAHCTLQYSIVNGQETTSNIRRVPNNNPIQNVQSSTLACNVNGENPAGSIQQVQAGGSITLEWHHEGRNTQAIDASHKGPILTYLAKVGSATSERNPANLDWFKIAHTGLEGENWAVDTLRANNGKWTVQIPSSIANGEYLIRQEIIALHSAYAPGGAQFYVGCAQISVTGGGSASPPTVKIPGVYDANHPGITISIYNSKGDPYPESYEIPGPEPFQ
ncbi:hypothetical protein AJ80_09452 [Polytolypa hystricis UAMH7299]|uniref:AA9 family lytic polysaccharide monooxygenase n=1 Tax=Polytolypa hystricis (strain UAMH7299) TaxID=1447883 RepID=A0A2B7WQJ3_POLH7|nr:hypothetical protein AJ80_09452 [Polytolypa hystricis UAMH7299]